MMFETFRYRLEALDYIVKGRRDDGSARECVSGKRL